jgi:hypothetical protein
MNNLYIGWVHPVAHVTMTWVQQSFIRNNASACFIKHVYHNMFRLKVIHVFNKARWNIVANEGLLYSFHCLWISPRNNTNSKFACYYCSILKMNAVFSFRTSVNFYQTTSRDIPEHGTQALQCWDTQIVLIAWNFRRVRTFSNKLIKTKLRDLSPRANSTDHLSAKLVPAFEDRGCRVVNLTGP